MTAAIDRERALSLYRRMALIREFEERLKTLVERGVPVGAVHYYTGQEAVAAGVCEALSESDWIASTHRGHGHCLAKGVDPAPMMAELYGKSTGTNRGKGGSMHITDISKGVLGVNPIVGMGVPHAVGAALSARMRGANEVAVAFFGEGATSMGVVHESMNLAAIWKLGVVFVCENNGYAQATPVEYAVANSDRIAERAAIYGMPGETVDGQDVREVFRAAARAVEHARSGGGPAFLECRTYRYYGHHQGDDPLRYRTAAEQSGARERDCVARGRAWLLAEGHADEPAIAKIEGEIRSRIDAAVAFAEASPVPGPEELLTDVYVPLAGEATR